MVTRSELAAFLRKEFPQNKCTIESVGQGQATVRHTVGEAELRPGGTVSGPVMMTVADVALYVALLGEIGIVPLAVTTSLNFLMFNYRGACVRCAARRRVASGEQAGREVQAGRRRGRRGGART